MKRGRPETFRNALTLLAPENPCSDGSYVVYHYSDGSLEYEEHFNATGALQEVLKYSYDADGNVEYLLYKNDNFGTAGAYDLYYYVRNATGDITDLFQVRAKNGSSTTVVNRLAAHYEYDPYGNILSINKYNNDPIGDINPIRYKDYYYDLQTGWYQLGSRFYDPEVGRFLNADSQISEGLLGTNLYAYCNSNPISCFDPEGYGPELILAAPAAIVEYCGQIIYIGLAAYLIYDTYKSYESGEYSIDFEPHAHAVTLSTVFSGLNTYYFAQHGKQNLRQTGTSLEELRSDLKRAEEKNNDKLAAQIKNRIKQLEKALDKANSKKRDNKHHNSGKKTVKKGKKK